jgi:hypothetical protein
MNEPIHYVVASEPVGTLFCGPTVWESSRTDRVTTQRRLVTCPVCLKKLAELPPPKEPPAP